MTLPEELSREIAKLLPSELIEKTIAAVLEKALQSLKYDSREVEKLVTEAVVSRTRELLLTQYQVEVDRQANILAARVVGELPRLTFDRR
jgi:hypothetical protein